VKPEQSFLHDIASPIATALLNLGSIVSLLEEQKPGELAECLELAKSCLEQMERATDMLRERRQALRGEGSAP
jgi:hypothetical protein